MSEKAKIKNTKRLPFHIQYAVVIWYFVMSIVFSFLLVIGGAVVGEQLPSVAMFVLVLVSPIVGFFTGWWVKFRYVRKEGDETQRLRVKAQFWGAMAFLVAFVASILLIFISLIMLESNDILPDAVSTPISFILAMLILVLSFLIAYNTKKRIYRNFGI